MNQLTSYFKQLKHEFNRVTWPSKKETIVSCAMVLLIVLLSCCLFFVVDYVMFHLVEFLIKLGV